MRSHRNKLCVGMEAAIILSQSPAESVLKIFSPAPYQNHWELTFTLCMTFMAEERGLTVDEVLGHRITLNFV